MVIQRWNPWHELTDMERKMDETMRYPLITLRRPLYWWRIHNGDAAWTPALEMYEKGDKYIVRAELPGMEKDDIDISVEGNVLTITGEKKAESEVKDEDYYRCEFNYGKFVRSVNLPKKVNPEKVEASYENGVLEISLPKVEEVKPKKVAIKARLSKPVESKRK